MSRPLILIGLAVALVGVLWPWLSGLSIGRLPGDIFIDRPGLKIFIPLTTMVILSILISLLWWLFRR